MNKKSKRYFFMLGLVTILSVGCATSHHKKAISKSIKPNRIASVEMKNNILSEKNIMQELTGKTAAVSIPQQAQLKNAPLSMQHYYAGQRAASQKNYILAIKHFNTVIKKYPRSAQVKPSLVAKAGLYKEMGLAEPSQLNMRLAQKKLVIKNKKKQTVKSQNSQKITK